MVTSSFWIGLGVFFGPSALAALHTPRLILRLALSVGLLALLAWLTWKVRRAALPGRREMVRQVGGARRIEAAALAGLLATLAMAAALGILLTGLMVVRFEAPEQTLLQALALVVNGHGTRLGPAFVPVAGALFFLAGLLWALPYALWLEPRLPGPDWLRGALFAALPTAVSWLVVLPLLGAGPLGLGLDAGFVPAAGEAVRHLLYGVALGEAYPVLLLARRPWHDWRLRPARPLEPVHPPHSQVAA